MSKKLKIGPRLVRPKRKSKKKSLLYKVTFTLFIIVALLLLLAGGAERLYSMINHEYRH